MPVYTNSIDAFEFEDMVGRLNPKAEQLEVLLRPGHDGETLRKTGVRAEPSRIVTMHFVADWAAAKAALEAYNALIDGEPYEVIQHDESYGYFRVLNVTEMPQTRFVTAVVGSIIPNASVQQFCQWTLLSTEAP
jgi:hypothetical protein